MRGYLKDFKVVEAADIYIKKMYIAIETAHLQQFRSLLMFI